MKKGFLLSLAVTTAAMLMTAGAAFAHDAIINTEIAGVGDGFIQYFPHEDDAPFKGWVTVNVKNTSTEMWGDFHFKIFSIGPSVANVDFIDYAPYQPTSTQTLGWWVIDNSPVAGSTMDLYFYDDPVMPGETAQFQVYTDNTTDQVWFGVCFYPTPVPEPGTLVAMAAGLAGFAGMIRRKK